MISASDLVKREVHHCVSHLVFVVAGGSGGNVESTTELADLAEQAFELCSPIDDFEEAASQEGYRQGAAGSWFNGNRYPDWTAANDEGDTFDNARDVCEHYDIEPYQRDVFEHWIVSDWLADKLEAKGEKIDKDFAGLTVWARTCTGQAIACDWVVEQIATEINSFKLMGVE
ncbi:hypothetical protein [Rhizobium sp. RAF56]|uniref:hypothetical protein n=1 Tax=Rhizobium sp. RAF56 TaxID=3233062 RepID=UPI003F96022D